MPDDSTSEHRLARLMNERRLDLGLRWEEVAGVIGITEGGLRALRRDGSVPRELTQRGIEKALRWQRGSVLRIIDGGDPAVLDDARLPPPLQRIADDPDLSPDFKQAFLRLASRMSGDAETGKPASGG
jgi:hypothetical protein